MNVLYYELKSKKNIYILIWGGGGGSGMAGEGARVCEFFVQKIQIYFILFFFCGGADRVSEREGGLE